MVAGFLKIGSSHVSPVAISFVASFRLPCRIGLPPGPSLGVSTESALIPITRLVIARA